MPHGDGTGPMGLGPGTGWGRGYCAGYTHPGWYRGRGLFGRGAGFRHGYRALGVPGWMQSRFYRWSPYPGPFPGQATEEDETVFLAREAEDLERALQKVRDRLQEIEKAGK